MENVINKLFLIAFAIGKDYMPFKTHKRDSSLHVVHKITTFVFTAVALVILCAILSPFMLVYFCLDNILKFVHGEFYGGLLNGCDSIFETKIGKSVINVVFIFACKEDPLILIERLKMRAFQLHHASFKFGSKIKSIFGYRYYIKNQVEFEDVTEFVHYNDREHLTKDNLLDYLEENSLKIENDQLWKVVFFSQPIHWHTSHAGGNQQLALVLSIRHAIGDFPSIIGFVKKHFQLVEDPGRSKSTSKSNTQEIELNLDNVCILRNPLLATINGPTLKLSDNLSGVVATFSEEKVEYIPKIKEIKQKLGVTFVETLSAAISVSIADYIKQQNVTVNNVTMGTVVRSIKEDVSEIVNGTFNFECLANNSGALLYNVPFKLEEGNMKSRILDMHSYNQHLTYAVDPFYLYMLTRYVSTCLPARLIQLLSEQVVKNITGGVSNVVGLTASTCCGSVINDMFFFAPIFKNVGCSFFIYSYAGRIQVTAVSRKGFVRSREDLQKILDNVFRNIDEASREILTVRM